MFFDGRKQLYPIAMSARLDPGRSAKRFALGSSAFAGQGAILEYELTLTSLQPVYETAAGGIAFKLPFCTIRNCASRAPMKDRHV